MDEDEKDETQEDLTPDEKAEEEETDATPEEAHREGEFDDLAAKLDKVIEGIDSLKSTLGVLVKSGAVTVDEGTDEDTVDEAPDEIPGIDDLDLSI